MDDNAARGLEKELARTRERLASLLSTSIEMVLCIEYDPPVATSLAPDAQAEALYASAVIAEINDAAAIPYHGRPASQLVGVRYADAVTPACATSCWNSSASSSRAATGKSTASTPSRRRTARLPGSR